MDVALNWLWQGVLVAVVATLLLRVIQPTNPQARYRVLWGAVLSLYLLPLVAVGVSLAAPDLESTMAVAAPPALLSLPASWWTSDAAAIALWCAWALVAGSRSVRSLGALRRATHASTPMSAVDEARLRCWNRVRGTGRPARLGLSDAVPSAAVLAGVPPVIAVAPSLVAQLTAEELDRVVIHEWAHVQRRDDLSILAQLFVRITLGWHPAAWWISRQLHAEREAACDQLAVSITGSAKAYAGCLAKLAELRTGALDPLPVAGATAGTGLRDRVVRILSPRRALSGWHRAGLRAASVVPCTIAIAIGGVTMIEAAAVVVAEVAQIDDFALSVVQELKPESAPAPHASPDTPPTTPVARRGRFGAVSQDSVTTEPILQSPAGAADAGPAVPADDPPLPIVPSTFTAPLDSPLRAPVPAQSTVPATSATTTTPPQAPTTIWGAAADGGTAVGRGSQKAAVATAGFFTRVSRKIAGSF